MSYVEMDYAGAGAKSADKISFDNSEAQISGNPNNVQDAIEQINSNLTVEELNYTLSQGSLFRGSIMRYGKLIVCSIGAGNFTNMPSGDWRLLITLPNGVAPKKDQSAIAVCNDSQLGLIKVTTDGKIYVYKSSGNITDVAFSTSFVMN